MKIILFIFLFTISIFGIDFQVGDIIFQETNSEQAKAIKLATKSKYTHVGVVMKYKDELMVLEAIGPVIKTPISKFINRGIGKKYKVKRLKNRDEIFTKENQDKFILEGEKYFGKPYDIYFGWSNDKIYCSELIWKIYKSVFNLEVGKLGRLKDFDLSSFAVKFLMFKRYGFKIPYNETVIPPSSMFDSELLKEVQ